MVCPDCSKRLPYFVRFCAYCGAALSLRLRMPWPTPARLRANPAYLAVLAGVLAGGLLGASLGAAAGSLALGAIMGAIGAAGSGALAAPFAGSMTEPRAASRFGKWLGGLGGLLTIAGGTVSGILLAVNTYGPQDAQALWAFINGGAYLGFMGGLAGAAAGLLAGSTTGWAAAVVGRRLAGRPGGIVGAALGWTAGSLVGGGAAGAYAAYVIGIDQLPAALLGAAVQPPAGVLLMFVIGVVLRPWLPKARP